MSNHRAGGLWSGNHGTLNPVAIKLGDYAAGLRSVTKISAGMLVNKAGGGGVPTVKLIKESDGCVLAVCSQAGSVSEVRFYSCGLQETMEILARFVLKAGWKLRFRKAAE